MKIFIKSTLLPFVFLTSTAASYTAIQYNLRITSALVYVIAIVFIASRTGLRYGFLTALTSSVIYNFFLSPPLLRFGIDSYDDVMPLIAFNTTAVFTGVLAGRLSERAHAAEKAQTRIQALLRTSDKLQQAITLDDVARSLVDQQAKLMFGNIDVYDGSGKPFGSGTIINSELYVQLVDSKNYLQKEGDAIYHVIRLGTDPVAILRFVGYDPELHGTQIDLESLINLIRLAVERCMLLKQQSQIEAIRRSEELKTAILSSISHDMRTPLGAISASASSLAMLQGSLNETVKKSLLETILAQCQRLDRFTTNLLDIGRLQTGLGDVERKAVDVVDIFGAVISTMRTRFPHVKICKSFSNDSIIVMANEVMIEQILANTLDNACRYAGAGTEVHLTTWAERSVGYVRIDDCGPGIAPDDLPHLFERFFRGSRTQHVFGTGLGLAIARGFVEAFGGTIRVISPANGQFSSSERPGTSVILQFPIICVS